MNAVVQILGKKVLKDLKKSDIKPNDDVSLFLLYIY